MKCFVKKWHGILIILNTCQNILIEFLKPRIKKIHKNSTSFPLISFLPDNSDKSTGWYHEKRLWKQNAAHIG